MVLNDLLFHKNGRGRAHHPELLVPLAVLFLCRHPMGYQERWSDLQYFFRRTGPLVGANFTPEENLMENLMGLINILVVGAGGLGCELLKDLALSGFQNLHVIDMDTIELSNLNRQFLFQNEDIGKAKAIVAAEKVMARVQGVTVTPYNCKIQDKELDFYRQFHIIVLGLDSLEARRWMNSVCCSFLAYDEEGKLDQSTIKPIIDGGSEGFKGHVRVIFPGLTPCFECTMWLFPPATKFPLCTLASTPRNAAHCIEFAHLIQWPQERSGEELDTDNPDHMNWLYERAKERAENFGIPGVTLHHTQGVVKNIVPTVASTNAAVSAACALETLKAASCISRQMKSYMLYSGGEGIYTMAEDYDRDPDCVICGPGTPLTMSKSATVDDLLKELIKTPVLQAKGVSFPSVSQGSKNIYLRGALESQYQENLSMTLIDCLDGRDKGILTVNDANLVNPIRVCLSLVDAKVSSDENVF